MYRLVWWHVCLDAADLGRNAAAGRHLCDCHRSDALACSCNVVQGDDSGRWALVGAVVFAISDSLLAINRFIDPFVGAAYLVMVTYWGGQLCLALSTRPQWKKMKAT